MHKVALLGMMLAAQGCVLGTRPTVRHVAMGIDGALAAGGIVLAATANKSSPELGQSVFDSTANSVQTDLGVAMLIAGLAGLVVNVALTPTEPTSVVRTVSPGSAPTVRVVPSAGLSLSALTIDPS